MTPESRVMIRMSGAKFKARQVLYLACTLFAKRTRICIWRARYLQSAPGFIFGMRATFEARFHRTSSDQAKKVFVRQHVASVDRTGRFHPYRPIFFCPFSIFPGCREYGAEVTSD